MSEAKRSTSRAPSKQELARRARARLDAMQAETERLRRTSTPLNAAIGRRVRQLRDDAHRTADEVAAIARSVGFKWTRAVVASVESGRRELSPSELLMLPFILSVATGKRLGLADVLLSDDILMLSENAFVQGRDIPVAITGDFDSIWAPHGIETALRSVILWERDTLGVSRMWRDATVGERQAAIESARGEAERKAASKLGVDSMAVSVAAHQLWGQGLTAERDARVGDVDDARKKQALRGHVTRELLSELKDRALKLDRKLKGVRRG